MGEKGKIVALAIIIAACLASAWYVLAETQWREAPAGPVILNPPR
jgi:hypothetical protein